MQCPIQNAFWSKHAVQILKLIYNEDWTDYANLKPDNCTVKGAMAIILANYKFLWSGRTEK